jgi:uncharacterized repeat protein (TIGR02543 family)
VTKRYVLIFLVLLIFVSFSNGVQANATKANQTVSPPEVLLESMLNFDDQVVQISMGAYFSSALTNSGRVFTWGFNAQGQLGNNSTTLSEVPVEITSYFPINDKVIDISLGQSQAAALTEGGKVFTWGNNTYGELGNSTFIGSLTPVDITDQFALLNEEDKITMISMGGNHASALTESGKLFTWGRNVVGQLGNNSTVNAFNPVDITYQFPAEDKIRSIEMGVLHSAALTESGKVFTWGKGGNGMLGNNSTSNSLVPIDITERFPVLDKVIQMSLGDDCSAALTESGKLFTWGYGFNGALGNETYANALVPVDITARFPAEEQLTHISIGLYHSSALTESGKLYTWGSGGSGRLGNDSISKSPIPIDITSRFPIDEKVISSSLGGFHSSALTQSGKVYTWGANSTGQLGINNTSDMRVPIQLETISKVETYKIIFNTNGGNIIDDLTAVKDSAIQEPEEPIKIGHSFDGWHSDEELTEYYTFSLMPGSNINLYAKWDVNQYTITFDSNGGSAVSAITQDYNSVVIAPSDPTKVGYTFTGWSQVVPLNMPAEHLTLTAEWSINQYTITFNTNGGSNMTPITQDYHSNIVLPSDPIKEGHIFNGYSMIVPSIMQAENLIIDVFWLKLETQSNVQAEVEGLLEAINQDILENKEIEVIIVIKHILTSEVEEQDIEIIKAQLKRNQQSRYLNIQILLQEDGKDDILIESLSQSIKITIVIPELDRGHKNYEVVRIHQGIYSLLDTKYDEEAHTLTFETDKFSTYAIIYDVSGQSWGWWLLLLIPLGFVIFFLFFGKRSEEDKEETIEETKEIIELDEVILEEVSERPKYKAFEKVENGNYLEITVEQEASNRVVEVNGGILPKLINEDNSFIALKKEEVKQFKIIPVSLKAFKKMTPGSYTDEGYFVEVDIDNKQIDNYVYTKKRLPPTTTKGHRWVRIETRRIKSSSKI